MCKHNAGRNAHTETHMSKSKLMYTHVTTYHYAEQNQHVCATDCTAGHICSQHAQVINICRYLSIGIVSWHALSSTASTSCPRAYMFLSALITTGGLITRLLPCANKKRYLSFSLQLQMRSCVVNLCWMHCMPVQRCVAQVAVKFVLYSAHAHSAGGFASAS